MIWSHFLLLIRLKDCEYARCRSNHRARWSVCIIARRNVGHFIGPLSCEGLLRRRRGPQDREFLIVPLENSYLILLNLRNNTFNDFLCCIRSIIFSKSVNFANGESLLVHMRGEKVTTYAGGGLHDLLSLCLWMEKREWSKMFEQS